LGKYSKNALFDQCLIYSLAITLSSNSDLILGYTSRVGFNLRYSIIEGVMNNEKNTIKAKNSIPSPDVTSKFPPRNDGFGMKWK